MTLKTVGQGLALLLLVLLPLAAVPLVGLWAAGVSGLLLLPILVYLVAPQTREWLDRLTVFLAVVGGLIRAVSAAMALAAVGGDPAYSSRVGFGWAAFVFAGLTVAAGLLVRTRPLVATGLLALGSLLGALTINLFYILVLHQHVLHGGCAALAPQRRPRRPFILSM